MQKISKMTKLSGGFKCFFSICYFLSHCFYYFPVEYLQYSHIVQILEKMSIYFII